MKRALAHPFADLIDLRVDERDPGSSVVSLTVDDRHLNPHGVAHGAVLYALADTGMGAAVYPTLETGETCATIEIKINYFRPVPRGHVTCRTRLVNRGRTLANLESKLYLGDTLVAAANGNFAIFVARTPTRS
jgi:acyl-CoA thioesterase